MSVTATTIEAIWPLSDIAAIRPIKRAGRRTVSEVQAKQGSFILKVADESASEESVRKNSAVFEFLAQHGFPAPRVLRTRAGRDYAAFDSALAYVLTYVEGRTPPAVPTTFRKLGDLMGRLHRLEGYPHRSNFTVGSEVPVMLERGRRFGADPKYMDLVRDLPNFDDVPVALIHTDVGPHNAVETRNGDLVLVDWDDAGLGPRIFDLGFPLICTFVTERFQYDLESARSFYEAYQSNVLLSMEEQALLFEAGMFCVLSYSIFDDFGIHETNRRKAEFALQNRDLIMSAFVQ